MFALSRSEPCEGHRRSRGVSSDEVLRTITKANSRGAQTFAAAICQALSELSVVVAGTAAAEQLLSYRLRQLHNLGVIADNRAASGGHHDLALDFAHCNF